jgi:hypothetical protein
MIWGRRRAYSFFASYNTDLSELKKRKKSYYATKKGYELKYIKPFDESLIREYDRIYKDHSDTIKRYPYPSNMLLEDSLPTFSEKTESTAEI